MSKVFFVHVPAFSQGIELWVTDGTPGGDHIVKDINAFPGADGLPEFLTNIDGTLYFIAQDSLADGVFELEKSDGTALGTNPIVIIPDTGNPALPKSDVSPNPALLTNVGGALFFTADDTIHGRELWTVTPAGTAALVKDIGPGALGSNPEQLTAINGTLFFTATDLVHGQELWTSDGTAAGTVMVKDVNVGSPTSNIVFYPNIDGTLFFTANDGVHGDELWTSDGTTAGTVIVADLNPGAGDTSFGAGADFHGALLFSANDGTHGTQLWKSDGTAAGTGAIANIETKLFSSAELNGFLCFDGSDGTHGFELWRTDGTTGGTVMIADINPSGDSDPRGMININGTLYFTAIDATHGRELWKSDGTAGGTMMVADIRSGGVSSNPNELINADGTLYFRANDGSGSALWKSDGTPGGTVEVASGFQTLSGLDDAAATSLTARSGPELLVNTNTAGDQTQASVAALLNGRFVEVWTDTSGAGGDASGSAIHGQIFNADGSKSGAEFLVNTTTAGDQSAPVVATLADGEFYVVWQDHSNGTNDDIRSQVFHADGTRNGGEQTEVALAGDQTQPAIVALPDGTAFPVWVDANTANYFSTSLTDVVVGGGDVSSQTSGDINIDPATAVRADGRYLVTWAAHSTIFPNLGIRTQLYDSSGGFAEVSVVSSAVNQTAPSAAALADGNFVIVWEDRSGSVSDPFGSSIRGQVIDGAAQPVGSAFQVNVTTAGDQTAPSVAALPDGRFVVAFADTSGGDSEIRAEILNADGTQAGEDFVINTTVAGDQTAPKVATLTDGRFVVTWDDNSQTGADTSGHAVRAQIIDPRQDGVTVNGTSGGDDFVGSSLNDIISGGPGDDHLAGGRGKDILAGGDGNDILVGGIGNDTLDGGAGSDTAVFSGARALYTISAIGGGFQVSGPDGIDALTNIEFAKFDDTTVSLTAGQAPPPPPPPAPPQQGPVTLQGTPGDDTFTALSGSERIDAFGGTDTVIFNFKLTDATITFSGNQVIVDTVSSHTVLTGFEIYQFTDGTVNNNDGNPLVDDLYYYSRYHDVWNAHGDADQHYAQTGWHELRNPNPFFDTGFYLSVYPDVKAAGVNPLTQYDQTGWTAGREPSTAFDGPAYLAANPDVAAAHVDPLAQFLANGEQEGRQPIALTSLITPNGFDYVYYLQHNPDVAAAHIDPFQHFETVGWKEGRNPNALFDVSGYLATYADVAAAHVNPLDQYHQTGWKEGRDPSVNFDTKNYLTHYPDIAAAHIDPLQQYLQSGIHEGRSTFADGVWG
jgi:ELWxxDGT repeat protein